MIWYQMNGNEKSLIQSTKYPLLELPLSTMDVSYFSSLHQPWMRVMIDTQHVQINRKSRTNWIAINRLSTTVKFDNLVFHPSLVQMVRPISFYLAKTKKATAPARNHNFVLNLWRFHSEEKKATCICALAKENEYQIETRCSELMKAKILENDDKRCAYITKNVGKNTASVRELLYDMFYVSETARKGKKGSGPLWIRPVHFSSHSPSRK